MDEQTESHLTLLDYQIDELKSTVADLEETVASMKEHLLTVAALNEQVDELKSEVSAIKLALVLDRLCIE